MRVPIISSLLYSKPTAGAMTQRACAADYCSWVCLSVCMCVCLLIKSYLWSVSVRAENAVIYSAGKENFLKRLCSRARVEAGTDSTTPQLMRGVAYFRARAVA